MAKNEKTATKRDRFYYFQLALRRLIKAYEDLKNTPILQVEKCSGDLIPDGIITGKFEIERAMDSKKLFFNLLAPNHTIIATSQNYSSISAAMRGINSVINNASKAPVEDQTLKKAEILSFPKWVIYLDNSDKYGFILYAANGSSVAHSQGYTTKMNCKKGIESVVKSCANAMIEKTYLHHE